MSDISFRIDPTQFAQNLTDGGDAVMAPGLFGGIAISRSPAEVDSFRQSVEHLGLTHIRWPGGTLSETAVIRDNGNIQLNTNPDLPYAYDLAYPDLLHPRALTEEDGTPTGRDGFTDMLKLAIEQDSSFSVILPTQRYVDHPEEAAEDVTDFLNALFVEDRWNDGVLPRKMVLDIGNENYNPEEYARVSVEILRAVRDFREAHPEEEFTLAMQAMQDGADTRELVSYLDDYMDEDDSGLLAEVDSVRVHVLKHSLSALRKLEHGKKSDAISELLEAVRSDRELMDFDPEDEVEVYFSAWTATANDVEADLALPMSSAIATISMFTGMAELGTDLAAGWGFGMEELGTHVTKSWLDPETGELRLSPHGEVFRQMAETLPGMKMLSHRQLDAGRDIPATYYAFTDETKAAIFLAANDIPDDGLEIEFDLSDFADFAGFEVESVSVPDGWAGEPVVSTPDLSIEGARLTVRLTSDYQVIRIIGHYEEPEDEDDAQAENDDDDPATGHAGDDGTESNTRDDGSLNIRGTEGDDTLSGSGLGDRMQGGPGDDRLFGGAGNDELFGGWGNDTIRGGTGDDALHLGMGQDHAWGGSGGDIFHVDVRAEAILHDFTAEDGDRIDFGGAYETAEDLLAVSSRGDYGGSGENRDLFLTHAAGGVTVLLGGASLWPDLPDLVLDVAETQPVTYTPIAPPLGGGDDVMLPHDPDRERQDAEEESDEDEDEEEDEGASASQGTCFVATAAFGDRMHPDVVWLRNWRDTVLVSTAPGRAFIRFYWKVGPVMARYVRSDRPSGRCFRKIITGIIRSLRCFWRA